MKYKIGTDGKVIGDISFLANCLNCNKENYQTVDGIIGRIKTGDDFDNYNITMDRGFADLRIPAVLRPSVPKILGKSEGQNLEGTEITAYLHDNRLVGISGLVSKE